MKTVREIVDAINSLDNLEEDEYFEILGALKDLAAEVGLDLDSEAEPYGYDDDEEDYDDDDEEEEDDDGDDF